MNTYNPIVLVEDDTDDCELMQQALLDAGSKNPFKCFTSGDEALLYLKNTTDSVFLIISDVNMPRMNGLDLKKNINKDEYLNNKNIPFVFLTTASTWVIVKEAHSLCPQGYFKKPNNISELTEIARNIVNYWQKNILPQNN